MVRTGRRSCAPDATAGRERGISSRVPIERDPRCGGRHLHARRDAITPVDHSTGHEVIAGPDESRQRLTSEERASDQQRRLPFAVAVTGRDGDRHDAKRRQVVGQLRRHGRVALGVRHDRAKEEGSGLEA